MSETEPVELIKPGELDKVPPSKWVAIVDGRVVAWADTLKELHKIMEEEWI